MGAPASQRAGADSNIEGWGETCNGEMLLDRKVNSLNSSALAGHTGIFYVCFTARASSYSY